LVKNFQVEEVRMPVAFLVVHMQYQINITSVASNCGLNSTRSIVDTDQ